MVNPSKDTGTRGETAVVRAARTRGFPSADRLTLTGGHDRGDVGLCPGVIVEVKSGKAAETASDGQIEAWLDETEREGIHAGAAVAVLVTKRKGVSAANAHRWSAWMRLGDLVDLSGDGLGAGHPDAEPVRLSFDAILAVLRAAGYGDADTRAAEQLAGQTSISDHLEETR